VESIEQHLRIYPLSQAANPPKTNFINVSGKPFNTIRAVDFSYFDEINEVVQEERNEAMTRSRSECSPPLALRKASPRS
jgi:hypothetical protein